MKIQNNIKFSSCTEEEGIGLLKLAGLETKIINLTFEVYEEGIKVFGVSSKSYLKNPEYLMRNIIMRRSFTRGKKAGKKKIQREIKQTLNI